MIRSRLFAFIILTIAMSACQPGEATTEATMALPSASVTPHQGDRTLLTWQGQTDAGCSTLSVTMSRKLTVGLCGKLANEPKTIEQEDSLVFLDAMAERLGPVDVTLNGDRLVFSGSGSGGDAVWQNALASWARWTFAEVHSGQACASCRTVLSWVTGPVEGETDVCGHVTVLNIGVAYSETGPCDGNSWTLKQRAVLSTERWEALDGWLGMYQAYDDGTNLFSGRGTEALSDDVIAEIDGWATEVYAEVARPD